MSLAIIDTSSLILQVSKPKTQELKGVLAMGCFLTPEPQLRPCLPTAPSDPLPPKNRETQELKEKALRTNTTLPQASTYPSSRLASGSVSLQKHT